MGIKLLDESRGTLDLVVRRENLVFYQRNAQKIGRGKDQWSMRGCESHRQFIGLLLTKRARLDKLPNALADAQGRPVVAFINDNRWMARCECGGLEVVDPEKPDDWFFCLRCYNHVEGGYPRPVHFPDPEKQAEIEVALMVSDDPLWRNWSSLSEDGGDPGSARVNRIPEVAEIEASLEAVKAANVIAGLAAEEEV